MGGGVEFGSMPGWMSFEEAEVINGKRCVLHWQGRPLIRRVVARVSAMGGARIFLLKEDGAKEELRQEALVLGVEYE